MRIFTSIENCVLFIFLGKWEISYGFCNGNIWGVVLTIGAIDWSRIEKWLIKLMSYNKHTFPLLRCAVILSIQDSELNFIAQCSKRIDNVPKILPLICSKNATHIFKQKCLRSNVLDNFTITFKQVSSLIQLPCCTTSPAA